MALEVFALIDQNGNNNAGVHILCGKGADLRNLAAPLQMAYEANKRKKSIEVLANKILEAASMPSPLVRLEKIEGAMLMDAISAAAEGKASSNKFAKLLAQLENSLGVY